MGANFLSNCNGDKIFKLYPHKMIQIDDNFYFFTSASNKISKIDDDFKYIIENHGKPYAEMEKNATKRMTRSRFEEVLSIMGDRGIIQCEEDENKIDEQHIHILEDTSIQSLILMVVQECNLSCVYCYGDDGEYKHSGKMSLEVATKSIDFLIQNRSENKGIGVVFFGGEPLLNFSLIKDVVDYIKVKEKEYGIRISKNITTNATLINEEIEKYLIENHINVKVSIDGWKELNDKNRPFKNEKGSYETVIENTKGLIGKNLASIRATVTPDCLDTRKIIEHLKNLGSRDVGFAYADRMLTEEDYFKIYKIQSSQLKAMEKDIKTESYAEVREKYTIGFMLLSKIHQNFIAKFPCGTGRSMYAVDIQGNLFPCHRFVGEDSYVLGNINESEVPHRNKYLSEIISDNRKQCHDCWVRNLCLGKCPHINLVLTGDVSKALPISCSLERALYEDVIKIYLRLSDKEKDILLDSKLKKMEC